MKYRSICLNTQEAYRNALQYLKAHTRYIEIVLVDESDTRLIDAFAKDIVETRKTKRWWGTKSSRASTLVTIKATSQLFHYLNGFSTFCILTTDAYGDHALSTEFGENDIAFFDEKKEPLLFTTTHEGYIEIREDICL